MTRVRIELLTALGCPNADSARKLLAECLSGSGISVPVLDRVGRFLSPTILIDGVDIMASEPTTAATAGDACRLDLPTTDRIRQALHSAVAKSAGSQRDRRGRDV